MLTLATYEEWRPISALPDLALPQLQGKFNLSAGLAAIDISAHTSSLSLFPAFKVLDLSARVSITQCFDAALCSDVPTQLVVSASGTVQLLDDPVRTPLRC